MFKLRNVSRTNQSFLPSLLPKNSVFKVAIHPNSNTRLAPGMCAIFTVTFKIDIFENRQETISFRSQSASETTVNLICFCNPPNLKIYVYKDLCRFVEKMDAMSISSFKMDRNFALNSTIDCGSCFIGNIQTTTLVLRNEGSAGKFFLVTEEDWYSSTVQVNYIIYFTSPASDFLILEHINWDDGGVATFYYFPVLFYSAGRPLYWSNYKFFPIKLWTRSGKTFPAVW